MKKDFQYAVLDTVFKIEKLVFTIQTELQTDKGLSFYLIHIRKLDMLN